MIAKPLKIKPITHYRIWVKYSDGVEGFVDLSHLKGKGVFKKWNNKTFFSRVYIDSETNAIAWDSEIELCPNAIYLNLIKKTFIEWRNSSK